MISVDSLLSNPTIVNDDLTVVKKIFTVRKALKYPFLSENGG
jgi:hypothetical protein